jgi:hypothetical protein
MQPLSSRIKGSILLGAACFWVFLCFAYSHLDTNASLVPRIWKINAFLIPLVFAFGGVWAFTPAPKAEIASKLWRWIVIIISGIAFLLAYFVCHEVLSELSWIWGRIEYDGKISLRVLSVQVLFGALFIANTMIYLFQRFVPLSRSAQVLMRAAASITISALVIAGVFFSYVQLFIEWRA